MKTFGSRLSNPSGSTDGVLSSEVQLLLSCLRTEMDPMNAQRITVLIEREEIDWLYLRRLADLHAVMPLLYRNISRLCPDLESLPVWAQLGQNFRANATRHLHLAGHLLSLCKELGEEGIPVIPYKGPVLAATVYGDLSLRNAGDLDILVRRQDAWRIRDFLLSRGYRSKEEFSRAQERALLKAYFNYTMIDDEAKVWLEIHWAFVPRYYSFRLEFEDLRPHLESVTLANTEFLNPSPEDLLLILCLHGTKHCWTRLQWICDVAELVRAYPALDWDQAMEQAAALGGQRMVWLGLSLAQDLLGSALPIGIRQRIENDPAVPSLSARVGKYLFDESTPLPGEFARFQFQIQARERFRDKVRNWFYLATSLNEKDIVFLRLPRFLFVLYPLARLIRLVATYTLKLIAPKR